MQFTNKAIPERFYSLDIIRGIAALTVLLWHWQHFLYGGAQDTSYRMADQPFYNYFAIFYHWGWLAVDFFFSLSGFVFFWLYEKSISERKVSGRSFFIARFSRLYPLHFLTFIFVLLAQHIFFSQEGTYFIYQFNDVQHALLNVFLASSWGMEKGASFNAPIWSVSIEVLLYVCFFFICLWHKARPSTLMILVALGLVVIEKYPEIGRGIISFFAGGLAFSVYCWIKESPSVRWLAPVLLLATLTSWTGLVFDFYSGALSSTVSEFINSIVPANLDKYVPGLMYRATMRGISIILFPTTIIALALIETWKGSLGSRLSFIGHLSYSSYLIHFPLQLCFILTAGWIGLERDYFYSEASFLTFVSVLIPLCFASYYFFETPMQRYLRRKLSSKVVAVPSEIVQ